MRNFITWVKGVLQMFFQRETIKRAVGAEVAISSGMQDAITLWQKMFCNEPPWLDKNTETLGLAAAVASEIARLVTVEFHSEISGSGRRAAFLQEGYAFVLSRLREQTEFAAAMGGLVFKPYMDGGKIAIDFVHADRFIPTAYNSRGEVTGAVFVERVKKGRAWYTRLESHQLTDAGYTVQNKAFISYQEGELGVPAALTSVDEWADLEESFVMGYQNGDTLERPLFVYFKMPFANHIDAESPLGVSVCARAAGLMEQADRQYSRILWEFEGAELAVDASVGALQADGKRLPVGKQRLFRSLNLEKGTTGDLYEVFSPAIRDTSLFNGLNQLLRRIEFNCNLVLRHLIRPTESGKDSGGNPHEQAAQLCGGLQYPEVLTGGVGASGLGDGLLHKPVSACARWGVRGYLQLGGRRADGHRRGICTDEGYGGCKYPQARKAAGVVFRHFRGGGKGLYSCAGYA